MSVEISRRMMLSAPLAVKFMAGLKAQAAASGKWEGIFVIMQTPFLQSLEIDEESFGFRKS